MEEVCGRIGCTGGCLGLHPTHAAACPALVSSCSACGRQRQNFGRWRCQLLWSNSTRCLHHLNVADFPYSELFREAMRAGQGASPSHATADQACYSQFLTLDIHTNPSAPIHAHLSMRAHSSASPYTFCFICQCEGLGPRRAGAKTELEDGGGTAKPGHPHAQGGAVEKGVSGVRAGAEFGRCKVWGKGGRQLWGSRSMGQGR